MRKTLKFLIASGACLVMVGTGQMSAQAAMNLETDAPVAGASVAINNYYASSLNPEKELAEALLILNYEGESAELYQDGRLVADSFYTGQSWESG